MKTNLGCFGFIKDIDTIARVGFNSIELHNIEIMDLDDSSFIRAKRKLKDSKITCEVVNNPLPLNVEIYDENFDIDYYIDYLKKGAYRVSELGAKYWNFGNGKTRSIPVRNEKKESDEKLLNFFSIMCDIALDSGIDILIEPLSSCVSNIILNIPEALNFIKKVGKVNVKTFVDMRWHLESSCPYSDIVDYADEIAHVHIDNPNTNFPSERIRVVPKIDDGFDYSPFLDCLKMIGYNKIISIEAITFSDFEADIRDGMEFFKAHGIFPL